MRGAWHLAGMGLAQYNPSFAGNQNRFGRISTISPGLDLVNEVGGFIQPIFFAFSIFFSIRNPRTA